jgi:phosphonate transport system substrate-binding protein
MKRHVLIALLALFWTAAVHSSPKELVFGSVAMDIPAEMHKRLTPLTNYLSAELGIPVRLHLSPNMAGAIGKVASGEVDIAYLTPVAYIDSNSQGQTRLVAKTITKGQGSFQLMVVARADGSIKGIADLRGRSFAFGDKKALLQRAVVVAAGLRLEDLGEYAFIGHYDNIARGVSIGDFDAGILKDTKAYAWQNKGLKIIHASDPLPPYNIAARSGLDEDTYQRIKAAFLKLDASKPEDSDVIQALSKNYDGFAETSDGEYDVVRKLVKPFR